ncbi:MAG TPA: MFS transporter [Actinocrinis sp.]
MTQVTQAAQPATQKRRADDGLVLALVCLAQFMVVLDVSIVNVALPSMGHDLRYSASGLQWVVNAYVLTFAGFLLFGGRAADLFGRRTIYIFGLSLFTLASLAGGLAQDAAWLTTARALQGLGGAFLSPATLTIIVTTFTDPKKRAKAIGLWSAVGGVGGAAGAVLGGVLTAELSWRWVLFVNIPVGIIGVAGAALHMTNQGRRAGAGGKQRLDIAGVVTITGGLSALVYGIIETSTHPWLSADTLSMLAVAALLLVAFAVIETRLASAPLVPFSLFTRGSVTGANVVMLTVGAVFFSLWYFLSLYFQDVLGYSALRAGLAFIPMALTIIVSAQLSPRLLPKTGLRPLLAVGLLLTAIGFYWLAQIPAHAAFATHVLGPSSLITFAMGLVFPPLTTAATSGIPFNQAGLSSGVLNTSRQIGGSVGLAALATAAVDRSHAVRGSSADVLTAGFHRAFVVAAVLILAGFVCALFIRPAAAAAPAPADQQPKAAPEPAGR